ncbi:MAG: aminopeptidase [Candidatus ainarchaeum sp.]|nr:aminopeptidase [Candidatus ainarchaeum sp.]
MAEEKKSEYDKLFLKKKSAYEIFNEKEIKEAFSISEDYKTFLDNNKSEREIVKYTENLAKKNGFISIEKATKKSNKIYAINHEKNIILVDLEKGKIEDGLRIIGSHIDSVRLDLKLNPIYESEPFAMINLRYYGGIKKYQWLNEPLALHGVIFDKNGNKKEITIGENIDEPVFVISDLLPHLEGKEYASKTALDIIQGEQLDAIGANMPINDKLLKEKIKGNFLKILNDKYKISEEDFVSADLSLYPAVKARDVGIDCSMIGAAAHDDRVCAYSAVKSIIDGTKKNGLVILTSNEEVGSRGNIGADSKFLENTISKIIELKEEKISALELLEKSIAISGDVTSGLDPKYADKMDPYNLNKLSYGIAIEKNIASPTSTASAEYMQFIRQMLDKKNIPWQYGELGKVDQAGGGTIAYLLARYNMDIVDAGPPVIAMHSPFEIISKVDLYATYKAYKEFMDN